MFYIRRTTSVLMIILILVGLAAVVFFYSFDPDEYKFAMITTPQGREIMVEVADTHGERASGLAGRKDVGIYDGMLFIYDHNQRSTFTTSEMYFSLDIIWLRDGQVVGIEDNVPYGLAVAYHPSSPGEINGVLEVTEDFFAEDELKVGDQLDIFLIK
ncbi:MAG: DUF192 domain-containing protein [Candidatus Uhrbacteria bacterium]